jgi:hypothetical protein
VERLKKFTNKFFDFSQFDFFPDSLNGECVNAAIVFSEDSALSSAILYNSKQVGESTLRVVECPFILPLNEREVKQQEKIRNAEDDMSAFESFKNNVSNTIQTIGNKIQENAQSVDDKLHVRARMSTAANATSNAFSSFFQKVKNTFANKDEKENADVYFFF